MTLLAWATAKIDIANNGEQARESFFTYVQHRMSGFGGRSDRPAFADMHAYPSFLELPMEQMRTRVQVDLLHAPKAIGAVKYEGPHDHDVTIEAILPHLYKARAGALMISMANPRHEHEYRCFERQRLPVDMNLIAGVIDTTTNYVEHPEVVAERIVRVAEAIGDPHRVMAGTDCGLETTRVGPRGRGSGVGKTARDAGWCRNREQATVRITASRIRPADTPLILRREARRAW